MSRVAREVLTGGWLVTSSCFDDVSHDVSISRKRRSSSPQKRREHSGYRVSLDTTGEDMPHAMTGLGPHSSARWHVGWAWMEAMAGGVRPSFSQEE